MGIDDKSKRNCGSSSNRIIGRGVWRMGLGVKVEQGVFGKWS